MLAALGIVFGDIGTSPLYTVRESFSHVIGLAPDTGNVLGVLSLIFWLLTVIVSGKYISLIMRADNKGEGGILSLHALVLRATKGLKSRRLIVILGLLGGSLFYGESVITPAISVISAVEGLEVAVPNMESLIVPITIIILLALFTVQRFGTAFIGRFFGPVMVIWFVVIGLLGLRMIIEYPIVLNAINPYYALSFIAHHNALTFLIMGAVVLAITGSEAIYVDMGHFGRTPIQRAWFFVAMPGLLLNYFGQGAVLLANPEAAANPFFIMAPNWLQLPLVGLATAATVIASQATISGAFSITRQAIQMGYLPRMLITHTSENEAGQIYMPLVNWLLMMMVVLLVLSFRSSGNLAGAYGISVTATMVITTLLAYQTMRLIWKWPAVTSMALCAPMIVLDLLLFSSNLFKIFDGGWLTLAIATAVFVLMITWYDGSRYLYKQITKTSFPLGDFIKSLADKKPIRIKGTAIYLVRSHGDTPYALMNILKYNQVVHERVIVLHISTSEEPRVAKSKRYTITSYGEGFEAIDANYGYMELPSIPLLLKQCVDENKLELDICSTAFIVSHVTVIPDEHLGLPYWQAVLFKWLHVNSLRSHFFFRIPTNRAFEIGIQIRV